MLSPRGARRASPSAWKGLLAAALVARIQQCIPIRPVDGRSYHTNKQNGEGGGASVGHSMRCRRQNHDLTQINKKCRGNWNKLYGWMSSVSTLFGLFISFSFRISSYSRHL